MMKRGDILKEYKVGRDILRDVFDRYIDGGPRYYIRTLFYRECCLCENTEWTDTGHKWVESDIRFLGKQFCPTHAILQPQIDKTLRQTWKAEAQDIITQIAKRI